MARGHVKNQVPSLSNNQSGRANEFEISRTVADHVRHYHHILGKQPPRGQQVEVTEAQVPDGMFPQQLFVPRDDLAVDIGTGHDCVGMVLRDEK